MARTTSDKKGNTVILRINEELNEKLKRESAGEGVSVSEYCRRVLSGETKCNTELGDIETLRSENSVLQKRIKELEGSKPTSDYVSDETRKDIERMCHLSGASTVYFNDEVCRLFNEGKIEFDCMKLKSKGEYDLSYLLDVCHRINADPQEMINKLANSLVRR